MTRVFLLIFIVFFLNSCQRKQNKNGNYINNEIIKISGSNSEYEMVRRLLEEFSKNKKFNYELEGTGSEKGIKQFMMNEIDMAMSSRRLKPYEFNILKSKGIDFIEIVFAYDALAFITNYKNSIDSLSIDQLHDILSGKIISWYQVSKFKAPIKIYGRNTESGTFHFIEDKFNIPGLRKYQITCNSSREIIENVMNDTCGLGYVSIGYILDHHKKLNKNIWPIPLYFQGSGISAVSPLQYHYVSKNLYPVFRPLYQYFCLPIKKELKEFLDFELSAQGQHLVESCGFYKINTELQIQNNIQLMKISEESKALNN